MRQESPRIHALGAPRRSDYHRAPAIKQVTITVEC
jgi:hypothetical protein